MAKGVMIAGAIVAGAAVAVVAGRQPVRRIAHAVATHADAAVKGATPAPTTIDPATIRPMQVGMNTASPFWTAEEPYIDPFFTHAQFHVGGVVGPYLVDQMKVDANGWPSNVPKGTLLTTYLGSARSLKAGASCTISPGWSVHAAVDLAVEQQGTRWSITPGSVGTSPAITMVAEKEGAALSNLSCRPKDMPADQRFRPDFVHDLSPFGVVRFMDWMKANYDTPGTWANRPTPANLSVLAAGAPLEDMVALANMNRSDPWFCLPLRADADYIRNFAMYVRDHLAKDRKVYVELSNEVWNTQFPQTKEATEKGKARYPGVDDGTASEYYYADRVRETMAIWTDVFAGQEGRLVRVLGAQASWADRAGIALDHKETWKSVDAVAIAPYFGAVIPSIEKAGPTRVEAFLRRGPEFVETAIGWSKANKAIANKYHLRLIAYEGGPGFEAFSPDQVADLNALQHDPRFYNVYTLFLDRWRKEIGDLFVAYSDLGPGYGHLDFTGQPWDQAPKMQAVADYATKVGSKPKS